MPRISGYHQWWYRRGKGKKDCALDPEKSMLCEQFDFNVRFQALRAHIKKGKVLQNCPMFSHAVTCACALTHIVLEFLCCDKDHDQNQLWRKVSISAYVSTVLHHYGKQPRGRSWSRDHGRGLLNAVPHGLLILLSYSSQDQHPWGSTVHSKLGLPHPSSIKKIHHRLAHSLIWWGYFLNWNSLF